MQQSMEWALAMPCACAGNPFGPDSICIRIGPRGPHLRFLHVAEKRVSFRCEVQQGQVWRAAFPCTVRRGYHCPPVQQPYNNTITLDGTIPKNPLRHAFAQLRTCQAHHDQSRSR